jgi:hypothetical protein
MWVWYWYDTLQDEANIWPNDDACADDDFHLCSEQCWMVPGTVDPNE